MPATTSPTISARISPSATESAGRVRGDARGGGARALTPRRLRRAAQPPKRVRWCRVARMLQDPGGRAPAPEPLREVQLFVNSVDTENGIEELDSPEALRDRLAARGLLDPDADVGEPELARAIEVREAFRALLLGEQRRARPGRGAADARARVRAGLSRRAARRRRRPSSCPRSAASTARSAGSSRSRSRRWPTAAGARLKACRREICKWAFYDRSRNGSSTWCSMSVCGNRTKTKAYRRRHA